MSAMLFMVGPFRTNEAVTETSRSKYLKSDNQFPFNVFNEKSLVFHLPRKGQQTYSSCWSTRGRQSWGDVINNHTVTRNHTRINNHTVTRNHTRINNHSH